MQHVRYPGSLDRLHFDERDDEKGVVLLDLSQSGLHTEPAWIPIAATPMLDVHIADTAELHVLEQTSGIQCLEATIDAAVRRILTQSSSSQSWRMYFMMQASAPDGTDWKKSPAITSRRSAIPFSFREGSLRAFSTTSGRS